MYYKFEEIELNLKYTWAISRNSSNYKKNIIISVTDGTYVGRGEAAPNIRYGETPEKLKENFKVLLERGLEKVEDLSQFIDFLQSHSLFSSLRFALEQAFVNYWCEAKKIQLCDLLEIPPLLNPVKTIFTLPIMPIDAIEEFYFNYKLERFEKIKLKINTENAISSVQKVADLGVKNILVDGNEAWQTASEVLRWQEKVADYPIQILEQPLPAINESEYRILKNQSLFPLIADESVTNKKIDENLVSQFHGINMKLMKAGGWFNGLELIKQAKSLNLITMIGCMVETSLGISAALPLANLVDFADLDGFLIIKNEPFKLVEEKSGNVNFVTKNS